MFERKDRGEADGGSRSPNAPSRAKGSVPGADYPSWAFGEQPVQAKDAGTADSAARGAPDVHEAARRGTSGAGGPLPFLDIIQRSFGKHDVSGVTAHTDAAAAAASEGMGAKAFTTGDHVAFGRAPSLHTAAHEAAHTVQQRAGVSLDGGVGKSGDRHEQHADAIAARVERGESAEPQLDAYVSAAGGGKGAAVQRDDEKDKKDKKGAAPANDAPSGAGAYTIAKFGFGNPAVPDPSKAFSDLVAELTANPLKNGDSMILVGHTDGIGAEAKNFALGQERADNVRAKLAATLPQGLTGQVTTGSLGKTDHAVPTEGVSPDNRRVEVHLRRAAAPAPPAPQKQQQQPVPGPLRPTREPDPKPPANPPAVDVKQLQNLADAIDKAADAVTQDAIVKKAEDLLPENLKKPFKEGVAAGTKEAIKAAIKSAIQALAGAPSAQPPNQYGPPLRELQKPVIVGPAVNIDPVKPAPHPGFSFAGVQASYKSGEFIEFTVQGADDFDPGKAPSGRVFLMDASEVEKNGVDHATSIGDGLKIEHKNEKKTMPPPAKPGRYVLVVKIGLTGRESPSRAFTVVGK